MRFALDGIPLQEKKTGVGHYTFELARALAGVAPQHEFQVVSPTHVSANAEPTQSLPANLRFVDAEVNGLKRRFWWSISLPRYCRQAGLALFHGTNFELPYWTTCPSVLTIHDLSLVLYPQTHEERLVRRARLKLPLVARRAKAIITPSQTVKSEVCEHLGVQPDKVFAIPEAARSNFYRVQPAESDPVCRRLGVESDFILFVGTIEPRKNLLHLARAFNEILRSTSHRPQLVIAGKQGWLFDDLMAYLGQQRIGERVLFTGHLADDELRALYSACRLFVYPSLYEGFGLPLLEAMACGAPVVTSNVPAIIETVADVACLVSPAEVRDLAQAICGLLEDDRERERRSTAGMKHAKKFSWERTALQTLGVYQTVHKLHGPNQ